MPPFPRSFLWRLWTIRGLESAPRRPSFAGAVVLRACLLGAMIGICAGSSRAAELPDIFSYRAKDMAALRNGFAQPPRAAGPWVIWFWWDGVLSRDEISRELEELAEAGFAGAEIRCVTFRGWSGEPLDHMDADSLARLGHQRTKYLSDEFIDMLEHACAKAESLGLRLGINMGQGWPPGGPWITDKHRTKHLIGSAHEVEGPAEFSKDDLSGESLAFAWRLDNGPTPRQVLPDSMLELSDRIGVENGRARLFWQAPAGRWLVGVFQVAPGGICDKGDGPEVDPASRQAVQFHLQHFFGRLDPRLSKYYGSTLADVASDSWEYGRGRGRYWSPEILRSFSEHAGYDLRRRMHALVGYGPDVAEVLHDLEEVERALVHENYFGTIARFLNERGLRHRPQVYGRGLARDYLEAYAIADIPEVEHGIVLPEAAWAAHLVGRPIVSAEAFTFINTKSEPIRYRHGLWETTPALLRWHANHFFAQGINRIHFHSFSYSPPDLPQPGWRMYAEIHFNRNLPWWWSTPELTGWMGRNQWLLQSGEPAADVLVYPVESNPSEGPYNQRFDEQPISAANGVDGLNRRALRKFSTDSQTQRPGAARLLLLSTPQSSSDAKRLLSLLQPGGQLLAATSAKQWQAFEQSVDQDVRTALQDLRDAERFIELAPDAWQAAIKERSTVRWSPSSEQITFHHRRTGQGHVYFLVNWGESFSGRVSFPHTEMLVEVWDADSGRVVPASQMQQLAGFTELPLKLGHFESTAISFSPGSMPTYVVEAAAGAFDRGEGERLEAHCTADGQYEATLSNGRTRRWTVKLPEPSSLGPSWRVRTLPGFAGTSASAPELLVSELTSWRNLAELRQYAGTVSYQTEFDMPRDSLQPTMRWELDLGAVFEVARIWINGQQAGTAWRPPYRLDVSRLLRPGANALRVDVANLLKNQLETEETYERPSGLLGPVRLTPIQLVELTAGKQ